MSEAETSVLRRKLKAARPAPVLSAMTAKKAMRLAVARAADTTLGCVVSLTELEETQGSPEDLMGTLPDPSLILRLAGPDMACGLAVLCPTAVAAMIETQTLGRVLSGKPQDRAPTRTDAMMVSRFVDQVLSGLAALLTGCDAVPPLKGFATAGPEPDLRAAGMALRDAGHALFAAGLDFSGGTKTGMLHIMVPATAETATASPVTSYWECRLNEAVMGSPTRLEAVLCRKRMPLASVSGLAVGDVLRLETASLDRVALCGPGGRTVLTARLGRSGASRALRLVLDETGPARIETRAGGVEKEVAVTGE